MQKNNITQAVILAAGLGTRLREVTGEKIPKVMVLLGGKPLLEYHIERLKNYGVQDFFINLFYLPDAIRDYFGDGSRWGVKIAYILEEDFIRGTAGGVKNFEGMLKGDFFVIYGDMFSTVDYAKMADDFKSKKDAVAMVAIGNADHPHDSDLVEVDATMRFTKFYQKPHTELPKEYYELLATYIFNEKVLNYIPKEKYYEIDHILLPDLLTKSEKIYGYKTDEYLMDIGTPERYRKAEEYIKNNQK